jgi:hypothetical protein
MNTNNNLGNNGAVGGGASFGNGSTVDFASLLAANQAGLIGGGNATDQAQVSVRNLVFGG